MNTTTPQYIERYLKGISEGFKTKKIKMHGISQMTDKAESVSDFLAIGGNVVEVPNGASAKVEHTTFGNKSKPTYKLPSSGYRHILERRNKNGNLTYAVKIYATHYGTLPSLDLAIHRRNKIWKKLGITEADFL